MNRSKNRAYEILDIYLSKMNEFEFVVSVILVGSLSDGTYTGNVGSDIDLVHIIDDNVDYEHAREIIYDLINKTEQETEKAIPFSRVVFQIKHIKHPYRYDFEICVENKALIERPIEIFRILDTGRTVYGMNMVADIEEPSREDVEMSYAMSVKLDEKCKIQNPDWYENYMQMKEKPTLRIMTQIVLTTALSDYYYFTNHNCSSKYRILECMERELPELEYIELLRLCHKNRFQPDMISQKEIEKMNEDYHNIFLRRKRTWEINAC